MNRKERMETNLVQIRTISGRLLEDDAYRNDLMETVGELQRMRNIIDNSIGICVQISKEAFERATDDTSS